MPDAASAGRRWESCYSGSVTSLYGPVSAPWPRSRSGRCTGPRCCLRPCKPRAHALAGAILLCLTHCRSPSGFLMTNWRDGKWGAIRMGLVHGAYCLGCCWALMCVLFVVGVMNLAWVAALTVFVLVEKLGPAGRFVARVAGVAIIVAGALVWSGRL